MIDKPGSGKVEPLRGRGTPTGGRSPATPKRPRSAMGDKYSQVPGNKPLDDEENRDFRETLVICFAMIMI